MKEEKLKKINLEEDKKSSSIKIKVNLREYPRDTFYLAAYSFLDRVYISLGKSSSETLADGTKVNTVIVELEPKDKTQATQEELVLLKKEFLNELLYATIRNNLSKKNKSIREAIVAQALFSAVGGFEEVCACEDNDEENGTSGIDNDPLGIGLPWEDKYSNK
jgi:His-Xaa-Ser system protein HxsD